MRLSNEEHMQISDLAETLGITTRTIRLYEKLGLVAPAVEQVRGFVRMLAGELPGSLWTWMIGAPTSEKQVTELMVMPPMRFKKMVFWLSALLRMPQLSQPAR